MEGIVSEVVGTSIKLYALMTPPAVLSAFISGTKEYGKKQKVTVAFKTSTAIFGFSSFWYARSTRAPAMRSATLSGCAGFTFSYISVPFPSGKKPLHNIVLWRYTAVFRHAVFSDNLENLSPDAVRLRHVFISDSDIR